MRLLILLSLLSLSCDAFSQTAPVLLWEKKEFVKNTSIVGPTVQIDKYENIYMLTSQTDVSPFTGISLVKYDSLGNEIWKINYPPDIFGHFYGSFTVDSSGNSYVSVCFNGNIPDYDADAIVVKYSPAGIKLWEKNYGLNQNGDSYIFRSELDTSGRLIVLGVHYGENNPSEDFLFIAALDTLNGDTIWRRSFPGFFDVHNLKIFPGYIQSLVSQFLPDNKYYGIIYLDYNGEILQYYSKPFDGNQLDFSYIGVNGNITLGNRSFGYAVTQLSPEGDTLWAYNYTDVIASSKNWARGVFQDDDSCVYATGAIHNFSRNGDFITTKFSSTGEVLWNNIYRLTNDSLFDTGNFIRVDDNYVYVIGGCQKTTTNTLLTILVYDKFSGNEAYVINIEDGLYADGKELLPIGGKLYYVGVTHQNNSVTAFVKTGCFQIPQITSLSDPGHSSSEVRVFPNPATDRIYLSGLDKRVFDRVTLYAAGGQIIGAYAVTDTEMSLLLPNLPAGIGWLTLTGNGVTITKKWVKR